MSAAAFEYNVPVTHGTVTCASACTTVVVGCGTVVVVVVINGKSPGGDAPRAAPMNSCQMRAGHVPPYTVMEVAGGDIDVFSSWGKPAQTAVDSVVAEPQNHAFL